MKHIAKSLFHNNELEANFKEMVFYQEIKGVLDHTNELYGVRFKKMLFNDVMNRIKRLSVYSSHHVLCIERD